MKAITFHTFAVTCLAAMTALGQQAAPGQTPQQQPNAPAVQRQQAQPQAQPQARSAIAAAPAHEQSLESVLADCFITGNQHEIALLKMGLEKSQNQQVKQLAQQMIQDHEQTIEKLAKFASKSHAKSADQAQTTQPAGAPAERADAANPAKPAATEVAGAPRVTQRANKPVVDGSSEHSGGIIDQLQQIEKQAADECLRLTKEELGKHQGAEFDKAFVGMQIGMHMGMLARLNASEKAVSGEFQTLLQDSAKKTQEHKDHLEKVMAQLKPEKAGDTPAAQPRTSAEPRPRQQ